MMCGLGSVMQMSGDGWRRYLTVMLDGMRAGAVASLRMSTAEIADQEVEEVGWDLDPLLDGDPSDPVAAVDAMLAEAQRRADAFSERYAGHVAELDGPGLAEAMHELGDLQEIVGRAGSFSGLHFSTDTADPERGALFQRVQEKATPIETKLLFFELEWAAIDDERADELLATEGLDFCRHHLHTARRYRPYLLSEPEEKILAEKALTARNAWGRLFEEQIAALAGRHGGGRRAGLARGRALAPALRRPLRARARRRARERRARARPAHPRVRLQHAAGRQDGRRPAARLQPLAAEPQPRQRGVRRVGAGAGHRGPQPLRAAAPLVPPEGAAARARPPQGLRPHGRGDGREPDRALGRGARPRAGLLLELLPRARRPRPPLPRPSAGSTRRSAPASARARSAPTRSRPCTRT